jgi:TRAP-type uncharacterized transport system fused permease subunit
MFIFYYAVLSEVSPPTALSPSPPRRSPAAIRTRRPCSAGKYTVPAFLLPSCSCSTLRPGLLLMARRRRGRGELARDRPGDADRGLGIAAIAGGFQAGRCAGRPASSVMLIVAAWRSYRALRRRDRLALIVVVLAMQRSWRTPAGAGQGC